MAGGRSLAVLAAARSIVAVAACRGGVLSVRQGRHAALMVRGRRMSILCRAR